MVDVAAFQFLLAALAGWLNGQQQEILAYLVEENRVLRAQLGGRRLRLTDDQRRRLAARGRPLGRRVLHHVATIVTPDTILRWHRQLIARKWTYARRQPGRPGVRQEIQRLVVRAHWGAIAGADLFTTEVWTWRGLVTYCTLFVIDLASRRVHIVGCTPNPNDAFMVQAGRTLTAAEDGLLAGHRVLICDRDRKWSASLRQLLGASGIRVVRTPFQAPNANAYAERFVRSIKQECLNRVIPFGERQFRRAISEFVEHYHRERNHQGLGNELIDGASSVGSGARIRRHQRLGGLLNFYHWAA